MQKYLFIGLGNPGSEFSRTRHNLGAMALEEWVKEKGGKIDNAVATVEMENAKVLCLFPQTFMNATGEAVANFLKYNPVELKNVLLLHDDLELPLGQIRLIEQGSAKGHNGVRSIHDKLETQELARLRLGIGRPPQSVEAKDFVLTNFMQAEFVPVNTMIVEAKSLLSAVVSNGIADVISQHRSLE